MPKRKQHHDSEAGEEGREERPQPAGKRRRAVRSAAGATKQVQTGHRGQTQGRGGAAAAAAAAAAGPAAAAGEAESDSEVGSSGSSAAASSDVATSECEEEADESEEEASSAGASQGGTAGQRVSVALPARCCCIVAGLHPAGAAKQGQQCNMTATATLPELYLILPVHAQPWLPPACMGHAALAGSSAEGRGQVSRPAARGRPAVDAGCAREPGGGGARPRPRPHRPLWPQGGCWAPAPWRTQQRA